MAGGPPIRRAGQCCSSTRGRATAPRRWQGAFLKRASGHSRTVAPLS